MIIYEVQNAVCDKKLIKIYLVDCICLVVSGSSNIFTIGSVSDWSCFNWATTSVLFSFRADTQRMKIHCSTSFQLFMIQNPISIYSTIILTIGNVLLGKKTSVHVHGEIHHVCFTEKVQFAIEQLLFIVDLKHKSMFFSLIITSNCSSAKIFCIRM